MQMLAVLTVQIFTNFNSNWNGNEVIMYVHNLFQYMGKKVDYNNMHACMHFVMILYFTSHILHYSNMFRIPNIWSGIQIIKIECTISLRYKLNDGWNSESLNLKKDPL